MSNTLIARPLVSFIESYTRFMCFTHQVSCRVQIREQHIHVPNKTSLEWLNLILRSTWFIFLSDNTKGLIKLYIKRLKTYFPNLTD